MKWQEAHEHFERAMRVAEQNGDRYVPIDSPCDCEHLDTFKGAPLRLPKPLLDQFPVRVCSCPLCM